MKSWISAKEHVTIGLALVKSNTYARKNCADIPRYLRWAAGLLNLIPPPLKLRSIAPVPSNFCAIVFDLTSERLKAHCECRNFVVNVEFIFIRFITLTFTLINSFCTCQI